MRFLAVLALTMGVPAEEPVVWVFCSPDSPDASRIFRELKGERVRAVLLVERYFGTREPSEAFLATIQAAGELRVVDEEGLRMARRLGIRRLPALAVVRGNRAHVSVGTQADVKELIRCSK
jgi:hypothetical protein